MSGVAVFALVMGAALLGGLAALFTCADNMSAMRRRCATLTGLNAALVQERDELRATVAAREADLRRLRAVRRA